MRRFVCVLAAFVASCTVGPGDAPEPEFIPCEVDDVDGGVVVDAGFCENPAFLGEGNDDDAGPDGNPRDDEADCVALVIKTCGAAAECGPDPGCVAAGLAQDFAAERCTAALDDNRGYPACVVGSCAELVDKVCGVDNACAASPSCDPALELRERADDGDTSARTSCGQALADEVIFPRCG